MALDTLAHSNDVRRREQKGRHNESRQDPQEGLVVLEVMYLHVPTCTSYGATADALMSTAVVGR